MECRPTCGMCCIAPSIVQAIPNMPNGKAAGVACANLDPNDYSCKIWHASNYPKFCRDFQAERDFCGNERDEAEQILTFLESSTHPQSL